MGRVRLCVFHIIPEWEGATDGGGPPEEDRLSVQLFRSEAGQTRDGALAELTAGFEPNFGF